MSSLDLIVLSTFPSAADAQIARGLLHAAGIESMVRTDDGGGMYPAIGGAQLLVRAEDRDKAEEVLRRA
jgi:Putative prokaryotic signal transducing protein